VATNIVSIGSSPRKKGSRDGGSGPSTPQRLLQYARDKFTVGTE
jgi:hypothetical protein